MLYNFLDRLHAADKISDADAHCDIPCGIYDPMPALIAAVSVVRLMDVMTEKDASSADPVALANFYARCAFRKEEEAEKVKHEIRIIWGDYFKGPLLEKHPEVHALVHSIMMKGSACKQDVHRQDALDLVELVNKFAELFWQTKSVATSRVTSPYPPSLEIVTPNL